MGGMCLLKAWKWCDTSCWERPKRPVTLIYWTGATCLSHSKYDFLILFIYFFIRGIYICLFPFIYKSCLCPKAMTPHGGAATLTCSCIAAGKADVRDHLWRNGAEHADGNLSYKHAFPSRAAPHPQLRGPSLQVRSPLPGKATTRLSAAQRASRDPTCLSVPLLAMGWRSHCLQLTGLPGWGWPVPPDEEWAWESHSWPLALSGIDIAP